jgi:hypothetical protein
MPRPFMGSEAMYGLAALVVVCALAISVLALALM